MFKIKPEYLEIAAGLLMAYGAYLVYKGNQMLQTTTPPTTPTSKIAQQPTEDVIISKVKDLINKDPSYWDNIHQINEDYVNGQITKRSAQMRTDKLNQIFFDDYRNYLFRSQGI